MSGGARAVSETVFSVPERDVCSSYCLCRVTRGTGTRFSLQLLKDETC